MHDRFNALYNANTLHLPLHRFHTFGQQISRICVCVCVFFFQIFLLLMLMSILFYGYLSLELFFSRHVAFAILFIAPHRFCVFYFDIRGSYCEHWCWHTGIFGILPVAAPIVPSIRISDAFCRQFCWKFILYKSILCYRLTYTNVRVH